HPHDIRGRPMSTKAATPAPQQLDSAVKRIVGSIQRERGMSRLVVFCLVVFALFSALRPQSFFTLVNFQTVGLGLPDIALLSLAVMISFVSGGIDLSIVSVAVFGALTVAYVFQAFDAASMSGGAAIGVILLAVALAIVVSALAGLLNGFLVSVVGITPIL